MNNGREIAKFMRENGFEVVRETSTGHYWSDGTSRIYAPDSKPGDHRAIKNLQAEVKRAIARRVMEKAIPEKEREPKMETAIVQREARRIIVPPKPLTVPLMEAARIVPPQNKKRGRVLGPNGRLTVYSETDKEVLKLRISELIKDENMTYRDITDVLNKEGFQNSEGREMTLGAVSSLIVDFGLSRRAIQKKEDARILAEAKKRLAEEKTVATRTTTVTIPVATPEQPRIALPPTVTASAPAVKQSAADDLMDRILNASDLSPEKKIELLKVYTAK